MFIAVLLEFLFWSARDLKTKYISCWRPRAVSCKEKHSLWLASAVNNHLCSKKSFTLARAPSTCRQKCPGQVQALHLDCPLLRSIRPHSLQPQEILGLTHTRFKIKKVERCAVKDTEKDMGTGERFLCLHEKLRFLTSTLCVNCKHTKHSSYQYFEPWRSLVVFLHPHSTCKFFVTLFSITEAQRGYFIFLFFVLTFVVA